MKRKYLLILAVPAIAFAQFAVIDVKGIAEAVSNGKTLYNQYTTLLNSYNQLVTAAQYLKNTAASWQSLHYALAFAAANDSQGINSGWLGSLNSGLKTATGYLGLVSTLDTSVANAPAEFQRAMQQRIAAAERIDGHVIDSANTLGRLTALSGGYQQRLQRLATATTSNAASDNTLAAIANKQNAAALLQLEASGQLTELLRQQLQQSNELMIQRREATASQINSDARFYATVSEALAQHTNNLSRDFQNMRLP